MCDCFFDELAYHRCNSATATFIDILISEFLQKELSVVRIFETEGGVI